MREYNRLQPGVRSPIPNLAQIRKEFGLTQHQLADFADLHINCISGLERGKNKTANRETQQKLIEAVATLRARNRPKRRVLKVARELTHA